MNYDMGKRPTVIGQLESMVQEKYGRTIYFKTRLAARGEALNTIYVTQEELEEKIHMDITYEEIRKKAGHPAYSIVQSMLTQV